MAPRLVKIYFTGSLCWFSSMRKGFLAAEAGMEPAGGPEGEVVGVRAEAVLVAVARAAAAVQKNFRVRRT